MGIVLDAVGRKDGKYKQSGKRNGNGDYLEGFLGSRAFAPTP